MKGGHNIAWDIRFGKLGESKQWKYCGNLGHHRLYQAIGHYVALSFRNFKDN
jgi:hypothetical protein